MAVPGIIDEAVEGEMFHGAEEPDEDDDWYCACWCHSQLVLDRSTDGQVPLQGHSHQVVCRRREDGPQRDLEHPEAAEHLPCDTVMATRRAVIVGGGDKNDGRHKIY